MASSVSTTQINNLIQNIKLEKGKIISLLCENQEVCFQVFNQFKNTYISQRNFFLFANFFSFDPSFKVKDIIKFLMLSYNVKDETLYYKLISNFSIDLNKKYEELNLTEKILVSLCCLLITDHEYYILNISTFDLNNKFWDLLLKFKEKNKGCLIISHNPIVIEKISDYVYISLDFKLIDQGLPSDLINKYVPKIFVEIFHSSPLKINDFIEALSRKRGINIISYDERVVKLETERLQDSLRRIFLSAEQADFIINNITFLFPTLNDVYKVIKERKYGGNKSNFI